MGTSFPPLLLNNSCSGRSFCGSVNGETWGILFSVVNGLKEGFFSAMKPGSLSPQKEAWFIHQWLNLETHLQVWIAGLNNQQLLNHPMLSEKPTELQKETLKNCLGAITIFSFPFLRRFLQTEPFFPPTKQLILKHHFEKRKRNKSKLFPIQKMS